MKVPILFSICMISLLACKEVIYICSPNDDQCVSVITYGETQYFINGKHSSLPDMNYVKLDISKRDIRDGLNICWKDIEYEWYAVIDHSIVVESKLDSNIFKFSTELPTNERGIPTEEKFRNENCASITLSTARTSPPAETTVEREKSYFFFR